MTTTAKQDVRISAEDAREILETLAVQDAADTARHGMQHGSRIARLQVSSWQAEIIRHSPEIKLARTPVEFRALMEDPAAHVIFLPQDAFITAEIIDRICAESPFNKMVIWETNA